MVRCNYHLDRPIERYTLRELKGMVRDLPKVHPMIGEPEEEKPTSGKPTSKSDRSPDDGTLHIPLA